MFYFIWLYVVRRTSYAGTTMNLQIVLNTSPPPPPPSKSSHPQKVLAQNKKSTKKFHPPSHLKSGVAPAKEVF